MIIVDNITSTNDSKKHYEDKEDENNKVKSKHVVKTTIEHSKCVNVPVCMRLTAPIVSCATKSI